METLIALGVFVAVFLSIKIAKTFPSVGVGAGLVLTAGACYCGYKAWPLWSMGVFGWVGFLIVLIPIGIVGGLGMSMIQVGRRVLRGESVDELEEDLMENFKKTTWYEPKWTLL